jgi:hypothetical protein
MYNLVRGNSTVATGKTWELKVQPDIDRTKKWKQQLSCHAVHALSLYHRTACWITIKFTLLEKAPPWIQACYIQSLHKAEGSATADCSDSNFDSSHSIKARMNSGSQRPFITEKPRCSFGFNLHIHLRSFQRTCQAVRVIHSLALRDGSLITPYRSTYL